MSSIKETIETCKDLKRERSTFQRFNNPAKLCFALAFLVPLVLLFLTSHPDSNGKADLSNSPYGVHAGIIFLVFMGMAIFLSRKSDPHKITQTEGWALVAYDTYNDIIEFKNNTDLTDVKLRAYDRFVDLIDGINSRFDSLDEILKWITQVNQVQKLMDSAEQNVLPVLESNDTAQLPELESYLIKFTAYLLEPNENLLIELLQIKVTSTSDLEEKTSRLSLLKNKPVKKIAVFLSILLGSAIATYVIAIEIGIEKNYAFGGSIAMLAALGTIFRHYIEK